ncbi:RNA 2'-phosphotransferase [uncultured Rikenella sp.]|uniref:RNA 2'-phosphotransferase n=1 Tax=uncultured Rikenella sp. TaxID=368003 RepID=UPI0025F0E510|nr:RNA 2'-phosphotransferase [uncultured Rikenella sp.]
MSGKRDMIERSKQLAYLLRHSRLPDEFGWVGVRVLVEEHGYSVAELEEIVTTDPKNRYEFSDDRLAVRARQGHSIPVELGLEEVVPPEVLYHGTASRFREAVLAEGLKPMSRNYVHLSATVEEARKVGERHGRPIVLVIDTGAVRGKGGVFYRASNGVWLTGPVAPEFISELSEE